MDKTLCDSECTFIMCSCIQEVEFKLRFKLRFSVFPTSLEVGNTLNVYWIVVIGAGKNCPLYRGF